MKRLALTLLSLGILVGCADSDPMTAPDPMATARTAASHNENAELADQAPGASVTVPLTAEPDSRFVSFVSMLICTNDGFTGVSGAKLPEQLGDEIDLYLSAYDAGTEINTQDFSDLVPPCPVLSGVATDKMGGGMSDPALAEDGMVHLHPGILDGVGDLDLAIQGWNDPVAKLTVRRTN
jgi:hypothetical protein